MSWMIKKISKNTDKEEKSKGKIMGEYKRMGGDRSEQPVFEALRAIFRTGIFRMFIGQISLRL